MHPAIIKNVIYPGYRLFRHSDVYEKLKELDKNQWISTKELNELSWNKLKLLLDYVYVNVPYYTELFNKLGIEPRNIQEPGDFRKIPILTKKTIGDNSKKMITTDPSRKGIASNTGGSTGETLYFYKDLGSIGYNKANLIRLNKWCGIDIGDKEAVFWGRPFDISRTKKVTDRIKEYMQNILYISTFDMSEKTMFEYAGCLRRFTPKIVRGYPSALFSFANFLKKNNIADIKPEAVVTTGEKTFSFQKELMEEVFGRVVYERYGSNEFGNIAHECAEHHGLHLINDLYYVEVLNDNRPAEKGEAGEIVVTSLDNYYMPFLRYKIGDLGILTDIQCNCGRGFPIMEEVEGRSFDMIVTPSGKTLGGFFWTFVSRAVSGIKQFQIVQKEKESIEFNIIPDKTFTVESQNHLQKEIKEKAGEDLKVNFKIVDEIPLSPSGKFRFIMSEISTERLVMKSKIHKAVITETNLNDIDSITVDEDLMKMVNLKEHEKVLLVDNTNGSRLEAYIRKGKKASRVVSVNGAAAHLVNKGDEIILMAFTWTDEQIVPQVILVNEQ